MEFTCTDFYVIHESFRRVVYEDFECMTSYGIKILKKFLDPDFFILQQFERTAIWYFHSIPQERMRVLQNEGYVWMTGFISWDRSWRIGFPFWSSEWQSDFLTAVGEERVHSFKTNPRAKVGIYKFAPEKNAWTRWISRDFEVYLILQNKCRACPGISDNQAFRLEQLDVKTKIPLQ